MTSSAARALTQAGSSLPDGHGRDPVDLGRAHAAERHEFSLHHFEGFCGGYGETKLLGGASMRVW